MAYNFDGKRFVIGKDYKSGGRQSWGVYDNVQRTFVEGGFFSKSAAIEAAIIWNKSMPVVVTPEAK